MTKIQKMNEHSWSRSSWDPAGVVRCFKCGVKKENDTPVECSVAKQQAKTGNEMDATPVTSPTQVEIIADRMHCWCSEHTYGRPSTSIIYTCCWCGKEQSVKGERKKIPFEEGHGPHGPTFDEIHAPKPPPEICPARV